MILMKLDPQTVENYYAESYPIDDRVSFLRDYANASGQSFQNLAPGYREILIDTPESYAKPGKGGIRLPYKPYYDTPPEIIDTYSEPTSDGGFLGKIREFVSSISLTDKTSTGVYESARPDIVRDNSLEARYAALARPVNVNANALNDPAAMALSTSIFGNPLTANYAQSGAIASGSDNASAVLNMFQGRSPDAQTFAEDPIPGEDIIPGVKQLNSISNCWEDPNCKGQIFLFIIGAIVLGLGIFALTR